MASDRERKKDMDRLKECLDNSTIFDHFVNRLEFDTVEETNFLHVRCENMPICFDVEELTILIAFCRKYNANLLLAYETPKGYDDSGNEIM